MANKRKREELSDSDSEEINPGKQSLPVANLPFDFDQEPQDGMQYLFLVRRDARRLPCVTRVRNPYEACGIEVAHSTPSSADVLPREEWRVAFQTHFFNLKKNLTQPTIHVDHGYPGSRRWVIPDRKDRDAWWKFLTGYPEAAWSPSARSVQKKLGAPLHMRASVGPIEAVLPEDATSLSGMQPRDRDGSCHFPIVACLDDLPRIVSGPPGSLCLRSAESMDGVSFAFDHLVSSEERQEGHDERHLPPKITPSHLKEIDHRMSIHLLMYFTHWINVHLQNPSDPLTTISVGHGQWMFALLTKIEDQLSADEMNLLRNLARACLGLIQRQRGKPDAVFERVSSPVVIENRIGMSDASCWMVFAAVAGHWGQRDLWADAEAKLTGA